MTARGISGNDSLESAKQALLRRLRALQDKAEEVAGQIRTVDRSFQDLGFGNLTFDLKNDVSKKRAVPQSGIRIGGVLSFRGKAMAEEQFKSMDSDGDGFLNYEDFRGNLATHAANGV